MKFHKLKFKIIAAALLFCALFIRIVPDYSTSQGSCIVNIFSYYKYQKGYCLKENRILSNEELLQNAATNYFKRYHDYEVLRNTIIDEHDIKNFGHSFYTAHISKLYLIGDFNEENWFDFLVENTDRKSFDYEINDKTQIDISDLSKYFVYKDEILGFRQSSASPSCAPRHTSAPFPRPPAPRPRLRPSRSSLTTSGVSSTR